MENILKKIIGYLQNNKKEVLLLSLILVFAAVLRLYKIREFVIFLGDEGRDALVVKRMIVDHKFTLLGPTASVGGFYLGPIYYYFMIPFLWASGFDPVGPAVMVALFGVATVFLLYKLVQKITAPFQAALTALLYSASPGIVMNSRSSWNPNIMPFFTLLSVYSLYLGITKKKSFWFLLAGIGYGIAIQSHYLGLILGPVLALAALVNLKPKNWIRVALTEMAGFVIGASLFITFEVRHGFPNSRNVLEFVSRGGNTTGFRSRDLIWLFYDVLNRVFTAVYKPSPIIKYAVAVSVIGFIFALFMEKRKNHSLSPGTKIFLVWLVVGILGVGSYKGELHAHYFGFLFPVPFILLAYLFTTLYQSRLCRQIIVVITLLFVVYSTNTLPIFGQGSNLINQTKNVASEIIAMTDKKQYNFALISGGNSDHAYRYFLEIMGYPPTLLQEKVTEQLLLVCEDYNNPCRPLGHPLWEVAGFGRAEIVEERVVEPGITIIKLEHHQDSENLVGKSAPQG